MKSVMTVACLSILQALLGCASFEPDRIQGPMPADDLIMEDLATPYMKYGGVI